MAGVLSLGKLTIAFGVDLGGLKSGLKDANDQLNQQKNNAQKTGMGISDLAQKYFFLKQGITDVFNAGKQLVDAWATQQRAVNSLNLALANQGNLLPGTSEKMQEQASALQKLTTFGDEAILKGQSFLAVQGLTADEIAKATPAILDMASAMGMDANQAFQLAGKAAGGFTSAFSRYGITVDESIPKGEKFNALVDAMNQKFGGMAQVLAQDGTGRMQQFANAIGDTKEQLGKFVTFFAQSTVGGGMGQGFSFLERIGKFFGEDLIIYLGMARQGFANMVASILEGAAGIGTAVNTIAGWFGSTFGADQVASLQAWAQGFRDAGQALYDEAVAAAASGPANEELTQKLLAQSNVVAEMNKQSGRHIFDLSQLPAAIATAQAAEAAHAAERAAILDQELAADQARIQSGIEAGMAYTSEMTKRLAADQALIASANRLGVTSRNESNSTLAQMKADYDAIKASGLFTTKELEKAWKKYEEERKRVTGESVQFTTDQYVSGTATVLGALSAFGGKFKSFAIAEAMINTYVGATKALRDYGWPLGAIMAAATIASGIAQVARIKSASFEVGTPGLDFANFGKQMPAMLHGREAVIPQGKGHMLADEIAVSLGNSMFSPVEFPSNPGGNEGGGQGGPIGPIVIELDGKVLAEWYEDGSKRGAIRTHEISVKDF